VITLNKCNIKSISSLKSSSFEQKEFLLIDGCFKGQIYPSIEYVKSLIRQHRFFSYQKNLLFLVTEKIIFKVLSMLQMVLAWISIKTSDELVA